MMSTRRNERRKKLIKGRVHSTFQASTWVMMGLTFFLGLNQEDEGGDEYKEESEEEESSENEGVGWAHTFELPCLHNNFYVTELPYIKCLPVKGGKGFQRGKKLGLLVCIFNCRYLRRVLMQP